MSKRSLKYRFLLRLCKAFKLQRVMALPPEKAQRLFRMKYHGVKIPKMSAKGMTIDRIEVEGCPVVRYRYDGGHKRVCVYLIGGGMLKYPSSKQAKEVLNLSRQCGIDFMLPYYPLVHTGHTITDVYAMLYSLYKQLLTQYEPDNIYFLGGSSGANLALGLISHINTLGEGLLLPGKIYASSPGSLLVTDEERRKADALDKTDVIMSQKGTLSVWEGMTGGRDVPDYMKSLQLGDYTGLKDVYMSFGGDEVFTAAADSIKARLESYGVNVTMEIGEGMYHAYAAIPLVKDAMPAYRRMIDYIKA